MKTKISIVLSVICLAFFCFQWCGTSETQAIDIPPEFIDLVDNTLIDPLQEFKEGTFILAFHDSELGMNDDQLREFKSREANDSKQIVKIDVNVLTDLARKYKVRNTPEYFVMKNGQVVYRDGQYGDQSNTFSNASHRANGPEPSGINSRTRSVRQ